MSPTSSGCHVAEHARGPNRPGAPSAQRAARGAGARAAPRRTGLRSPEAPLGLPALRPDTHHLRARPAGTDLGIERITRTRAADSPQTRVDPVSVGARSYPVGDEEEIDGVRRNRDAPRATRPFPDRPRSTWTAGPRPSPGGCAASTRTAPTMSTTTRRRRSRRRTAGSRRCAPDPSSVASHACTPWSSSSVRSSTAPRPTRGCAAVPPDRPHARHPVCSDRAGCRWSPRRLRAAGVHELGTRHTAGRRDDHLVRHCGGRRAERCAACDRTGPSAAARGPAACAQASGSCWPTTAAAPPTRRRRQRSERNAARISAEKSSGSSHAAKWPPRSTALK